MQEYATVRYVSICLSAIVNAVPFRLARCSEVKEAENTVSCAAMATASIVIAARSSTRPRPDSERRRTRNRRRQRNVAIGYDPVTWRQVPGTTLHVVDVTAVVTPGAPGGGIVIGVNFVFPDIVALSAMTGPVTYEFPEPL